MIMPHLLAMPCIFIEVYKEQIHGLYLCWSLHSFVYVTWHYMVDLMCPQMSGYISTWFYVLGDHVTYVSTLPLSLGVHKSSSIKIGAPTLVVV